MKFETPYELLPLPDMVFFQEGPGLRNWQFARDGDGVPFLNIRTIRDDGTIDIGLCQFVKQDEFDGKYEHFLLDEGDFVVSSSGTLGKLAEVRKRDLPLMLNTSVIRFRPIDPRRLDRDYLKWFIKSPIYMHQITAASRGIAIKNYGPSHLKEMFIPVPPIQVQKSIAAILNKSAAIHRKRQQAIDLVEELLRSVFLDMFGDPVSNPNGWEMVRLGDTIESYFGGASIKPAEFAYEGFPVLHKGAVKPLGNIEIDPRKKGFVSSRVAERYSNAIVGGDHVGVTLRDLVPTGPTIGMAAAVSRADDQRYLLAQGAYGLKFDQEEILPDFFVLLTNMGSFRHEIRRVAVGSTQIHVRITDYLELRIPKPEIQLQKRFSDIVSQTNSYLKQLEKSAVICGELFKSCVSHGFGGKL